MKCVYATFIISHLGILLFSLSPVWLCSILSFFLAVSVFVGLFIVPDKNRIELSFLAKISSTVY